jgi:hypothetical protein
MILYIDLVVLPLVHTYTVGTVCIFFVVTVQYSTIYIYLYMYCEDTPFFYNSQRNRTSL